MHTELLEFGRLYIKSMVPEVTLECESKCWDCLAGCLEEITLHSRLCFLMTE